MHITKSSVIKKYAVNSDKLFKKHRSARTPYSICKLIGVSWFNSKYANTQSSTGATGNMHAPVINWCNENMPTVSYQLVNIEICQTVTVFSPRNLNGNCETIKTPKNNSFSHLENTEYPAYINNPFESRDHHRGTAGDFDYHLNRCFKS